MEEISIADWRFYTGIPKVQERDFDKVFTSNKETFKAGDGLDH